MVDGPLQGQTSSSEGFVLTLLTHEDIPNKPSPLLFSLDVVISYFALFMFNSQ